PITPLYAFRESGKTADELHEARCSGHAALRLPVGPREAQHGRDVLRLVECEQLPGQLVEPARRQPGTGQAVELGTQLGRGQEVRGLALRDLDVGLERAAAGDDADAPRHL